MTDPMQAALAEDVMRLTQERDKYRSDLRDSEEEYSNVLQENRHLAEQLDELEKQLQRTEMERDMAYHAYDKLREEYLALTFEPVTPQLEDTFPEVGTSGAGDSTPVSVFVPFEPAPDKTEG